jgi:prepilin-type N-terminal cleavage/methylation domain-containing protein
VRPHSRGFSLLEPMIAMAVVLVGGMVVIGLHQVGLVLNDDARHVTRATAIAQDLLSQIEAWDYGDARLQNSNTSNDADLGDSGFAFQGSSPPFDHREADLAAGTFQGIPTTELDAGYERYWNVAYPDDSNGNGVADGVRVAVIVRWPHGAGWRRVVLLGIKRNPVETR